MAKTETHAPTNAEIIRLLETIRTEIDDLKQRQAQLSEAVKALAKR